MTTTPQAHCCTPQTTSGTDEPCSPRTTPGTSVVHAGGRHLVEQCAVPAQTFAMGDAHDDGKPFDGEQPVHRATVAAFSIDATAVTVAEFTSFVDATGHRTDAEQAGVSAVFHLAVAADAADVVGPAALTPWWWSVRGADWRHPDGPLSDVAGREDHPVVHVSWYDAQAYCAWAGRSLPTEAQWECASRGGLDRARYPWGDDLAEGADWRLNIWQGNFPDANAREDGWLTTAPVRSYAPNGYGLWQTVGNVWEWCQDVFDRRAYDPDAPPPRSGGPRVLRGGSYLCHDSYCNRYRNAARSSNTPRSTTANAGFRTVAP